MRGNRGRVHGISITAMRRRLRRRHDDVSLLRRLRRENLLWLRLPPAIRPGGPTGTLLGHDRVHSQPRLDVVGRVRVRVLFARAETRTARKGTESAAG